MRVTVVGASGQFGSIVSDLLEKEGADVVRAHRGTGVDAAGGDGLAAACDGADVIVDATNMMSMSARKSKTFFGAVAANISRVAAESETPVVYLTIYGADDPAVNAKMGHYQGKAEQEATYAQRLGPAATAVASTQWFTLPETFLKQTSLGPLGVVPHAQSRLADVGEVAAAAVATVLNPLRPARLVVAGPEVLDLHDAAVAYAKKVGTPRKVISIPFGGKAFRDGGLVPERPDVVTATTFDQWLAGR